MRQMINKERALLFIINYYFKIQRQHKESVLLQVPIIDHFMFIVALRSCYVLGPKWFNFGKVISLSVRYHGTEDSAEGSSGRMENMEDWADPRARRKKYRQTDEFD